MNRFNSLNYGFAVSLVRVFESRLIKNDEFDCLKACCSVEEFVTELKRINYDFYDFFDCADFKLKLNESFSERVLDIKKNCPSYAPFGLVFFENDCFNLKVVLSCLKKGLNYNNLILKPSFLPIGAVNSCFLNNNFEVLQEPFNHLAIWLNEVLNSEVSVFEFFSLFNKKKFEVKFSFCKFDEFFFNRVKLEVDIFNFGLVLKALKFNFDEEVFRSVLVDGGSIESDLIFKAFCAGVSSLSRLFKVGLDFNLTNLLYSPGLIYEAFFEKFREFDETVSGFPFSFYAIVAYLNKLQKEHKSLKEILTKISFSGG